MTQTPDRLGDDELGALLTETFAAHEHLADPGRAVAIASSPGRLRHLGRIVLGAAAAVALVAGGTTYLVSQGAGTQAPEVGPSSSPRDAGHQPPLPPPQTEAGNRAAARRVADRLVEQVPVYAGARPSGAIPALHPTYASFEESGHTATRTRWWTVSGSTPRAVARWYVAHPAPGLVSDGGVDSTTRTGGPTVRYATFSRPGQSETLPPVGGHVLVETTQLTSGVGVRVTVESVWPPPRPRASYVQDVSSIDVRQIHDLSPVHRLRTEVVRRSEITDPGQVLAAARAFDALPGLNQVELNCPLIRSSFADEITFHTATGTVVAVSHSDVCSSGVTVSRDGHRVGPQLGYPSALLRVLGLSH
jgi:hypothetical protein